MKRLLVSILLLNASLSNIAQTYNNEWIDYSKTYFKFKVGANGLFRITQPALATINLQNTDAQHFKLWRNGVEVPLFTSDR